MTSVLPLRVCGMNGQHIVLAGGSGFLGRSLMRALTGSGCRITVLTRSETMTADKDVRYVTWDACSLGCWTDAIEGADAIVNLTGKNVNCRLTERNRREIVTSRRDAVTVLGARGEPLPKETRRIRTMQRCRRLWRHRELLR